MFIPPELEHHHSKFLKYHFRRNSKTLSETLFLQTWHEFVYNIFNLFILSERNTCQHVFTIPAIVADLVWYSGGSQQKLRCWINNCYILEKEDILLQKSHLFHYKLICNKVKKKISYALPKKTGRQLWSKSMCSAIYMWRT